MSDKDTLKVYDARAAEYARLTGEGQASDPHLAAFIEECEAGGRVLDLGCGPGVAAGVLAQAGFEVDATDASSEMVALAARRPGVTAWQASFDDIEGSALYDGIWANFCLLHAPRADMPRHLAALHAALKPGGLFHIGLKTGTGEKRDALGRFYTYYTEAELEDLLSDAGFAVQFRAYGRDKGLDGVDADWIVMRALA